MKKTMPTRAESDFGKGEFLMDIGKRISTLRRERGWTQAQLAEKLVITDKAVSKWEQGRGDPELSSIVKLSEVFGVTTDCLLIDKVWESRNVVSVNPRTNKIIRIGKSIEAATHAELLNRLLGKDFDGYMKCTYNIDCLNTIWMIRLDGTVGPTGFANVLIDDKRLVERCVLEDSQKGLKPASHQRRYVFEIVNSNYGKRLYVFRGAFELVEEESDNSTNVWRLVSEMVNFDALTDTKILVQKEKDAEYLRQRWRELEKNLAAEMGADQAKEIVLALRELYSIYSKDVVDWHANLYDPSVGGYYFSNSARENEGFLPDIESTMFALGSFRGLGMAGKFNNDIFSALPPFMKAQVGKFVKGLQDPNGYFYHPQWGKEMTDSHKPRRGRDLTMVTRIFEWLGMSPTYDTPHGVKGDGLLADGTPVEIRPQAAVPESPDGGKVYDPVLKDKESFLEYLSGFKIDLDKPNTSYEVGSAFECQAPEILARDKELEAAGADYRLADILVEWFAKYQDPETGAFVNPDRIGLGAVNGILKIASAIHRVGRTFPYAVEAFRTARNVIVSDEEPNTVCWVLNPWYSLTVIMNNVAETSRRNNDYAAERQIAELRAEMIKNYPEMIRATAKKLMKFRKPDGSFSYLKERTSHVSHEMPVAVSGTNEGDFNSTNICTAGIVGHIFVMLKQEMIPFFTEADRLRYVAIIEEKERNRNEK